MVGVIFLSVICYLNPVSHLVRKPLNGCSYILAIANAKRVFLTALKFGFRVTSILINRRVILKLRCETYNLFVGAFHSGLYSFLIGQEFFSESCTKALLLNKSLLT